MSGATQAETAERPSAANKAWSPAEEARLTRLIHGGAEPYEAARALGRSMAAVRFRIAALGLQGFVQHVRLPVRAALPAAPALAADDWRGHGLPLADLGDDQCRWPVNSRKGDEPHLFCAAATDGGTYCPHHAGRAGAGYRLRGLTREENGRV